MYVESVHIQNLKLLRDVKLDFLRGETPRLWTVIIGENGCGKTSILQSIALAAMGVDRANQLADFTSLPDRRDENAKGVCIDATFRFGPLRADVRKMPSSNGADSKDSRLNSSLQLQPGWSVFKGDSHYLPNTSAEVNGGGFDPLRTARGENLPHWFVAGYGVERSLPTPLSIPSVSDGILQRVSSLFSRGRIVGTGFADMFEKELVLNFSRTLQEATVTSGLLPHIKLLDLRGKGGVKHAGQLIESHRFVLQAGSSEVKLPAVWLSQGYQATVAWIADLIGQQFWDCDSSVKLEDMEGLVLIDELDLFLHPVWQAQLVQTLKHVFPRMQFVVTTHSPMVLPGCEQDEVFILQQNEEGDVVVHPADASPGIMSGSELYRMFFGVEGEFPNKAGRLLQEYAFLASNPFRSDADDVQITKLVKQLSDVGVTPDWQPEPRKRASAKPSRAKKVKP